MRKTRVLLQSLLAKLSALSPTRRLDPLPLRNDLRSYNGSKFAKDARAATNVALLAFPQGMAFAAIAELPILYGIVTGAVASVIAPLFTGSRHTILGPTNATALIIASHFAGTAELGSISVVPLLVLLVGGLLILGAALRIADLIQYVSRSVVVGYLTGAAVLIIANQLRHVLGVTLEAGPDGHGPRTFISIVLATMRQGQNLNWHAVGLAAVGGGAYWFIRWRLPRLPAFAIALLVCSLTYYTGVHLGTLQVDTFAAFRLTDLRFGLPQVSSRGIFYDLNTLFGLALSVAFLCALENSVMSKSLASRSGDRPDVNQDMFGVGVANVASALVGGMPASASLTRSALNFESGAVSRFSSILSGLLCGLGLMSLGPLMIYVPKSGLAALIICVAVSLVNRRQLRIALRATPSDAAVLLTTFVGALLMPLNLAIFLGVSVSIMLYLRQAARPHLREYEFSEHGELRETGEEGARHHPAISIVHVEGELFFGAAELFRTQIQATCADPDLRIVILRLKNARHLDATSVMALEELIRFLRSTDRQLIISGATKEVYRVLKNSGMVEVIGRENIFLNSPRSPNLSTRKALLRAQEWLGTDDVEVRIFFDPGRETSGGH
ncbi:MAG: SulP family inorganic anion transporter [Akkermansiaceae bacterium]|nr:SulP family inorganic anion transporter [Verrucomicrobiae bacterium]MCP5555924.1 SulP family inorganic anion transporter [Akkermansiaceae bacterium]